MNRKTWLIILFIIVFAAALFIKQLFFGPFVMLQRDDKLKLKELNQEEKGEYAEFYGLEAIDLTDNSGDKEVRQYKPTEKTIEICNSLNFFVFAPRNFINQTSVEYRSWNIYYASGFYDGITGKWTELTYGEKTYKEVNSYLPLGYYYFWFSADWILDNPEEAYKLIQQAKSGECEFLPPNLLERVTADKIDGLTLQEYMSYLLYYDIGTDQMNIMDIYEKGYSAVTEPLQASENTVMTVKLINLFLWTDLDQIKEQYPNIYQNAIEDDEKREEAVQDARKIAVKKYGFSPENPLTAEWVVQNPETAYHLACDFGYAFSTEFVLYSLFMDGPMWLDEREKTGEFGKEYDDVDYYYFADDNISIMNGRYHEWNLIDTDSLPSSGD